MSAIVNSKKYIFVFSLSQGKGSYNSKNPPVSRFMGGGGIDWGAGPWCKWFILIFIA